MGRGPAYDLTNQTFTYLTALYYAGNGKWHCKCKCGREIDVRTNRLRTLHTQSCGCLQKEKASLNKVNMLGFENDGIVVIAEAPSDNKGFAQWKCKCKKCGREFISRGKSIRENRVNSCGCTQSYNENIIAKLLSDNKINFIQQYSFSDLVGLGGRPLRFDFAIFDDNNQLSHLIEYNGQQHYIQSEGSWSSSFEITQTHDKLKQMYCKNHNIPLRIIRYDESYNLSDLI